MKNYDEMLDLAELLTCWATHDPREVSDEAAERAICRAAAEITGLTADGVLTAARVWDGCLAPYVDEPPALSALRRFAELAREEAQHE